MVSDNLLRRVGRVFVLLGIVVLLTVAVINPWLVEWLFPERYVVRLEVIHAYMRAALWVGGVLILIGLLTRKFGHAATLKVGLLVTACGALLLLDRLLLVVLGLPLWTHDPQIHYRHRPNAIRHWGPRFDYKAIRINAYGHHDHDFPTSKAPGEFRGVMLGDSVTMGHGVTRDETFANQLEEMIRARDPACDAQIINTGVQGYATFQELVILKDSLVFEPDFVAIAFVLNDVTEPWKINRDFGGSGVDYHAVTQTSSPLVGYLINETGVGRLAHRLAVADKSLDAEKREEVYNVGRLARLKDDEPRLQKAWEVALRDMAEVYATARQNDIPTLLLIFPFTFQLLDDDAKNPQAILRAHAEEHGVPYIDFTEIFETLILDETTSGDAKEQIATYFLDADHLTPLGHQIVAEHVLAYLERSDLLDLSKRRCAGDSKSTP